MYSEKTKSGSIVEVRGWWRRKLFIDGYPQTQAAYRRDWKTILSRSMVEDLPRRGSALVLGLGGGDLACILDKLRPGWKTVFVELEPEVVQVAEEYFGIGTTNERTIVVGDAQIYMERNLKKHDLVIVDLYSGDDVPTFVSGGKFLGEIVKALKPGGKAIFNYASHSFRDKDFAVFEGKLKSAFGSVTTLKTWGHTYYLASMV
jgi:spermidine synthase